MSCFQHNPHHIAAILGSCMAQLPQLTEDLAHEFGGRFANVNAEAVNERCRNATRVEPVKVTYQMIRAWAERPLNGASLRLAMRSLAYQCCDADGWEASAEGAFLCMLKAFLPAPVRLAEEDSACWSFSTPPS